MVVVAGAAAPVRGLTLAGSQDVDLTDVHHRLQGAVHRRQADPRALLAECGEDLLRGVERLLLGEEA
jgi:hypothetical protein